METKLIRRKSPSNDRDVEKKTKKILSGSCYRSLIATHLKTQYRKTEQQLQQPKKPPALRSSNDYDVKTKKNALNGYLCGICFDFKKRSEMFMFRGGSKCKHPFCTDCISKHVAAKIRQNNLKVNCPDPDCGVELKPKHLNHILPEEVVVRWESVRCESLIARWKKAYCPFKNCSEMLLVEDDGGEIVTSAECPSCHRLFCAQCRVPWHAGMNCKEFLKKSKSKEGKDSSERKFLDLAKRERWQRCPKCNFYVQRRGGCEHMKCRCGCNFCYKCGKDWMHGHICQMNHDDDDYGTSIGVLPCIISVLCLITVLGGIVFINWETVKSFI